MTTSFISTAIPYVNARPHLGFAYELVLADILARHRRQRGRRVRFVTGTDEHSLKNVEAAHRVGVPVQELVDRNARAFQELGSLLDVCADDFVRTSIDPRHRTATLALWHACREDLYRSRWQGRYCAGCEAFVDEHVKVCAEHNAEPEPVEEENWFFRLSRYRDAVRDAIESGRVQIVPESARSETLAFLAGGVRDLSVSRVATGWGIEVPEDPSQVIYVWFDALANYIVDLDAWRSADERTHVIGKGITRFHAVYWLAFLLAAKLPLPHRIFVHGYLTVDGVKIAKTGNCIEVAPFVEHCGADALRWFYARQCRTRTDADVSLDAVLRCHDRDLADRFGNLAHRTLTLANKIGIGDPDAGPELRAQAEALPVRVDAALDAFAVDEAAAAIIELVDAANRYLDATAPWRTHASLHPVLEAARIAAEELAPFVPGIARTVADRLAGRASGPPPVGRKIVGR